MVVSLCSIYLVYVEKSSLSMEQFLCLKLSEFITIADNVNIFLFLPSAGFPRKTVCVQELCHALFGIVSNSGCICIRRYFLSMLFCLTFVFLWFTWSKFVLPFCQEFLRQNNTGKLLWQVFGTQAANLCLYGISEHEEIMWNALNMAGG